MTRKNTFVTLALILAQMLSLAYVYAAEKPAVIKKADLPASLKGGKVAKNADGIPGCATGRAKVALSSLGDWAEAHKDHACAGVAEVYVCRVGKNLSVRCE